MQALKGIVIGLGLMIVLLMAVIGYGLYRKANDPGFRFLDLGAEPVTETTVRGGADDGPAAGPVAPPLATAGPAPKPFGRAAVPLQRGDVVESMTAEGDRLLLRVTRADGQREIVVVDLNRGTVLGTLELGNRP
jgi:hypothetical protein